VEAPAGEPSAAEEGHSATGTEPVNAGTAADQAEQVGLPGADAETVTGARSGTPKSAAGEMLGSSPYGQEETASVRGELVDIFA